MASWFGCGGVDTLGCRNPERGGSTASLQQSHPASQTAVEAGGCVWPARRKAASNSSSGGEISASGDKEWLDANVDVHVLSMEKLPTEQQGLQGSLNSNVLDSSEYDKLLARVAVLEKFCWGVPSEREDLEAPVSMHDRNKRSGAPGPTSDLENALPDHTHQTAGAGVLPLLATNGERYIPKANGGVAASFDKDVLNEIYERPYKLARERGAFVGGGVLGLLSLPFGPIGMAAGGLLGWICGAFIGFMIDRRIIAAKSHESSVQFRRFRSLMRWAHQRVNEADDQEELLTLVETIILEFKPIADVAEGSEAARRMLHLLNKWIARRKVSHALWNYMDMLLLNWKTLSRGQFMKSLIAFQTLSVMYRLCPRALDEQEAAFVDQMHALLGHSSIKLVMEHANMYPTAGDTKVMECMVYADALERQTAVGGWSSLVMQHSPYASERRTGRLPTKSSKDGGLSVAAVSIDEEAGLEANNYDDDVMSGESQAAEEAVAPNDVSLQMASQQAPAMSEGSKQKKPPKPFFKGWQDFMDFDVDVKHQMPITFSEFDLLLQKSQESTVGWDVCVERKEIKVCKVQSGEGNITIRAWAKIPDVDINVAFNLFYDNKARVKWDKVFNEMRVLEQKGAGLDIIYCLIRATGVTAREFVQYRRVQAQEDGSILIVMRSADHPGAPPRKDAIRAESYISGYVLRQEYDGDKPVLSVFIMSCCDVKGLIPKWIISYMAPKKPAEWCDSLRAAALEYQKSNPNYKEMLKEQLDSFHAEKTWESEPVRCHSPKSASGT
mmetsp:Transcript_61779/g.147404  ORF Transcript_61779/g.147404 Transcript_61779/m.147404 type:complete len:781 (+) Transcript_61779:90-2432(+)